MNNISIVPMNSFSSSEGEKVFKKVSVENSRHTKAEQPITTSPREKTNQEKPHPKFKERVANFLDSSQVTIFMTVVTVYALFGDDIRLAAFSKPADNVFNGLTLASLVLFSAELILSCWAKPGFLWSFYFWLDFLSTISLIPDISWIWYPMIGLDQESSDTSNATQIQNAGKLSRAGARTSRIIRVIRLIRLIRIVKLYKNAQQALKEREDYEEAEEDLNEIPQESQVGKKLSDLTTKRVILLILLMLISLPLMEVEFYANPQTSWDFGLSKLMDFSDTESFNLILDEYKEYHLDQIRPIVYLSIETSSLNYSWEGEISPDDLRINESHYAYETDALAVFDLRQEIQLGAILNLCKTIFICIVLTMGALYFTKDANELVIHPIEKMIDKVKSISKNPLNASKPTMPTIYDIQSESTGCCGMCKGKKGDSADYETELLENTIVKIGVLLALGFGEAGSGIIATNMQKDGDVDLMLGGDKCVAIFGFCDIRNFTDTTEELLEDVMVFVNEIAKVVHGTVDKYQGSANKNIGDAFLLVWKFEKEDFFLEGDEIMASEHSSKAKYMPDLALLAFLKIIAKINQDPTLLKYRNNQKLNRRIPNYQVKMGFGLHIGWAIEGAIGSEYKIDASYLSPHVNLASRLEAATKQYGVPLLISGEFVSYLSKEVKDYCRHVDTVTVKGTTKPMQLFTSDVDFSLLKPSKPKSLDKQSSNATRRRIKKEIESHCLKPIDLYKKSSSLNEMRSELTQDFLEEFSQAVNNYISGDWSSAKLKLDRCLEMKQGDGPCLNLLSFMEEYNFSAPSDWDGYRVLTEK